MSGPQSYRVEDLIVDTIRPDVAVHGDCVGADAEFHSICMLLGIPIIIYPPENPDLRAFCKGAAKVMPAMPYLDRNRAMVDLSHTTLAAPDSMKERLRSGTWATVRYTRYENHALYIAFPDGTTKRED
jgi:hypothetical protein